MTLTASTLRLALVLTGGGARAAYRVGVLQALTRHVQRARFDIVTGTSAGAIHIVSRSEFAYFRDPRSS